MAQSAVISISSDNIYYLPIREVTNATEAEAFLSEPVRQELSEKDREFYSLVALVVTAIIFITLLVVFASAKTDCELANKADQKQCWQDFNHRWKTY